MRREASRIGLLFVALGAIIGSGWLLSPMYAAQIAGPAALLAWVLAGLAMVAIGLQIAELSTMFPLAGGIARFPYFAFGGLAGYLVGWLAWLGFATSAAIQVLTALQYASNYIPWLTHEEGGDITLTVGGYAVAVGLMLLFAAINIMGVRWLLRTTTIFGWWKVLVPVIMGLLIIAVGFHTHNLTGYGGFAPSGIKGILLAISTGGIIFAFNGFEQAAVMAGESQNPRRNVPFAVIGSIAIASVIYVILQLALLLGIGPAALRHGWAGVSISGTYGPFATIATALGLSWVAVLVYISAFASPFGCGLVYVGSAARTSYAVARNAEIGGPLTALSKKGVPVFDILLAAAVGMIALFPLPGWQVLVSFITSAIVMMYALMPLTCAALRRQLPNADRPYRVMGGDAFAFLGFVIANFVIYWAGWATNWKLLVAIGLGLVVLVFSLRTQRARANLELRHAWWFLPYLVGLGILSYLSTFGGGSGVIPFGWDFPVVIAFSAVIWLLALASRLPVEGAEQNVHTTAWEA
jgi:Gamma-aminobutyrate permease and related permeases